MVVWEMTRDCARGQTSIKTMRSGRENGICFFNLIIFLILEKDDESGRKKLDVCRITEHKSQLQRRQDSTARGGVLKPNHHGHHLSHHQLPPAYHQPTTDPPTPLVTGASTIATKRASHLRPANRDPPSTVQPARHRGLDLCRHHLSPLPPRETSNHADTASAVWCHIPQLPLICCPSVPLNRAAPSRSQREPRVHRAASWSESNPLGTDKTRERERSEARRGEANSLPLRVFTSIRHSFFL